MKIGAVSGDTVVYLAVGVVALVAVWYGVTKAKETVGGIVDAVIELPGKAAEIVIEAASSAASAVVEAPGKAYDAVNETLGAAVIENPTWAP